MKHIPRFILSFLLAAGFTGIMMSAVNADPVYKATEVTFHQPVEIPGRVLPAGTYVLKLVDPYLDQNIVRFYDPQEQHMYAMVRTVPTYRLNAADHTVITFEERAHDAPQAIKDWFYAGDHWGQEFVYPKAESPHPTPVAAVVPPPAAPQPPKQIAQVKPELKPQPVEIAQTKPAPAPAAQAAPAPVQKPAEKSPLPKTASDQPLEAMVGGIFLSAGLFLRKRSA